MIRLALLLILSTPSVWADTYVAARTIRPQQVISPGDLAATDAATPGAESELSQIVGKEARVAIFAGRPIFTADLTDPAMIERNQIVLLTYDRGAVQISAEGRALDRAAAGDLVRVMNLASRNTITARVMPDGSLYVD